MWALACLIFGCVSADAQNITTVVGGGPVGLTPTAASVGSPVAVRRDSQNNAYILDNTYGRVLKIDHTTGLMSVYAGNGVVGFSGDGSAATGAQMNGPSGMCFDSNDNLYIADSDNAVIRVVIGPNHVTPPSLVTTIPVVVAGNIYTAVGIQTSTNPEFGGDGTPALSSHLHFPDGCSFDTNGNLYIADRGNNEVRVVIGTTAVTPPGLTGPLTPGNIYRFAGAAGGSFPNPPAGGYAPDNSPAVTGALYGPFDVFVDASNNVFIADLGNNFGADGTPNTQTGQPLNNNVIREVLAADGTIHTVAGIAQQYPNPAPVASGVATAVALNEPKGLSVDSLGNLYFCDTLTQVIRKVSGGNISVYAGTLGSGGYSGDNGPATSGKISFPAGTFVDTTGNLFIADDVNNAIREVPATTGGGLTALDIYTFAGNGHLSFGGDNATATTGQLNTPAGLGTDAAGDVFVADSANDLIRKVSGAPAKLSTIAGSPEANGFLNIPTSAINAALGVATDASGNVYIADTANCIVRKLTSAGITTVAGVEPPIVNPDNAIANTPKCGFDAAGGLATGTHIGAVNSVAVDSNGNIFFSDKTNSVIWEVPVTAAGTLLANHAYIVAGKTTAGFSGDGGPANAAQLSGPTGIYVDVYNNLFIADAGNHRLREVPSINVGTTMTAGFIYTIAGNGTSGNTGDAAPAINAELATPFAIAVDSSENVFFSDTTNQTIREIAGSTAGGHTVGDIYTVAGTKNAAGFTGDGGPATSAKFSGPEGLALQANASPSTTANLLVSDSGNNRVRSIANLASNAAPLAQLSPNPVTFASQTVNTPSTAAVVTLSNSGGAALSVTGVTIGGTNASDFMETDDCTTPGSVAPGGSCTINVVFTPAASGASTATLTVADSAFGGSQTVTLTGTGANPTPPALTLTVKDTDASPSQTVTAGATATYNLSVTSNQTTNVTATITCTGAPTAATCASTPGSVTVVPTTGGAFKVSVTTTARGELLPFNQPSTKLQPPTFLQIAPMVSIALLFLIAMMLGWMQNEAGRARILRVALTLALILMPIAAATVLVGCGGGSSSTTPPPASGTAAGTYTLTVTATSGTTTATTALTLVVN